MKAKEIAATTTQGSQQIRKELLGEWYNYESGDSPLSKSQIDHWLAKLEDTLKQRPARITA